MRVGGPRRVTEGLHGAGRGSYLPYNRGSLTVFSGRDGEIYGTRRHLRNANNPRHD